MCAHGTAVLTALQANHKSVDDIGELVQDRVFDTVIRGGSADEWLKTFWYTMSILRANGQAVCGSDRNCITAENGSSAIECKSRLPHKFKGKAVKPKWI